MSSIDYIIDEITFSYSSLSSFSTCKYAFKLSYIDKVLPRESNFFGEFGTLTHDTLEQYFGGKLEAYQLSQYFADTFNTTVRTSPPQYPAGMLERYKDGGLTFFNNFSFDMDKYDMLGIEEKLTGNIKGVKFTGRPDLVLREKSSKLNYLVDYKSSTPFWTDKRSGKAKEDAGKIEGYAKQMHIYTYLLRTISNIKIDNIMLWFTRLDKKYIIPWEQKKEEEVTEWVLDVVKQIKAEETFEYNNSNSFFCNQLCDVREHCIYRAK